MEGKEESLLGLGGEKLVLRLNKASTGRENAPTPEEIQWEEAAKAIALKVQRQQQGIESAMISAEHQDAAFQPMTEMKDLLSQQYDAQFNKKQGRLGLKSSFHSTGSFLASLSPFGSSTSDENSNITEIEKEEIKSSSSNEMKEKVAKWYVERSKYIPVRLTFEERKFLRLIEAIFKASEYTDLVDGDISKLKTPQKRMHRQMQAVSALLASLTVSLRYEVGLKVIQDKSFNQYNKDYARVLELCRRYKIMNPEKLRSTYGKLIYFLQDASIPEISEALGIDLITESSGKGKIKTVYSVLEEADALDVLKSDLLVSATREIVVTPDKPRKEVQRELKHKELALKSLASEFANDNISAEDLKQCIFSIGDNSNYLLHNCEPIEYMIDLLKLYFSPDLMETDDDEFSLAIYGEREGSRLTHSHLRQYNYVLQSLTLWKEILHDMFRLWYLAEQDLLDHKNPYKLVDTGQGVHRLQPAPRTLKAIYGILYSVQQQLNKNSATSSDWIGSSVIHLGDTNVPNAFMFIDKYNQVPRILNPIVNCLRNIDSFVVQNDGLLKFVKDSYGSVDGCKKTILRSFFREGFDGSGGDNFFEAGSCIDGRLTSAWNWCQKLPEKDFFYLFKLSGFLGFDGNFQS